MPERRVLASYETIRRWCASFGQTYANQLHRRGPSPSTHSTSTHGTSTRSSSARLTPRAVTSKMVVSGAEGAGLRIARSFRSEVVTAAPQRPRRRRIESKRVRGSGVWRSAFRKSRIRLSDCRSIIRILPFPLRLRDGIPRWGASLSALRVSLVAAGEVFFEDHDVAAGHFRVKVPEHLSGTVPPIGSPCS